MIRCQDLLAKFLIANSIEVFGAKSFWREEVMDAANEAKLQLIEENAFTERGFRRQIMKNQTFGAGLIY